VLGTLERLGINRGVFGGSKGWFYVGSGLWTLRTVRRMAERKSEVLISEPIRAGQRIVIANGTATVEGEPAPYRGRKGRPKAGTTAPKGRKERKAAARADAKSTGRRRRSSAES